jgi:hypothetical protein
MSALIPASRIAGRRILRSAAYKGQKQARRAAVDSQAVTSLTWSRKIITSSTTSNDRQVAPVKDDITPDVTVTLPNAPSRPLSLSAQRTAAQLADTLELLEGKVGGTPEWSRRVETALEELKTGSERKGRLAGEFFALLQQK